MYQVVFLYFLVRDGLKRTILKGDGKTKRGAVVYPKTKTWPMVKQNVASWRRGVVVITTVQLHSTKPELRFSACSNSDCGVSEIHDGEDLWQWSWLEIFIILFIYTLFKVDLHITLQKAN